MGILSSVGKMFGLGGGGGSSPPPAPDFTKAAITQGKVSNPNINNPFGSQNVTWNGSIPTINQSLSPQLQALMGNAGQFDMSGIPQAPVNPGQTGQDAIMSRLQPQIERQQDRLRTQLSNQGINLGSEAFTNAFQDQGQIHNDLLSQAALHGIGLDTQARQQAFGEQSYLRNLPLQDMSVIRSLMPQSNFQPAPIFDATMAQSGYNTDVYNAQQARDANMMSGLFGLGGSLGAAWLLSDRRMKRDIARVGALESGIPVYQYRYVDDNVQRIGVMADEAEKVIPEAVIEVNGRKAVRYEKLH